LIVVRTEWSLLLEYMVVAIAVSVSVWVVIRKQFPRAERRFRIALAAPLVRDGRPHWLRAFGRLIAPAPRAAPDTACGGCARCDDDNTDHA
jgi:hypothetical protein